MDLAQACAESVENNARRLYEIDAGRMRTCWEHLPEEVRRRYRQLAEAEVLNQAAQACAEEWRMD